MTQRAFEDMVDWQCFACGRLNEHGLRIKSYWSGEDVVCTWRPDPLYVGHPERLHAGLVATIMLCHLAWAATALAHRRLGLEIREPIDFFYGVKSFKMDILKPFSIHRAVTIRAQVRDLEGDRATVVCSAHTEDEEHARGEAELFRFIPEEVPAEPGV